MVGTVEEIEIPTSESDVDVHVLLDQHEDDITRILEKLLIVTGEFNIRLAVLC
jgi:hypothetical protein